MEQDKHLIAGNDHASPPGQHAPTLIMPSSLTATTIDEMEIEERHGGQYHLRHQLSGCAQTLHVVDFQQDFSLSEPEHILIAPALQDGPQTGLSPVVSANAETLVERLPQHFNTLIDPVTEPLSLTAVVSENTHSPATLSSLPHAAIHAFSSAITTASIPDAMPEQTISVDANAENNLTADVYHTDVKDMALGDWLSGMGLSTEQHLENGRLHFKGDELQANQILLQQRFILPESGYFQFEMEVNSSAGSGELPQFNMLINDVLVAMETYQVGHAVVLRSEFMMPANEPVSLAILPVSSLPSGTSLWIDNLQLQPWLPESSKNAFLLDSPLDDTHAEIALAMPEKHPDITQVLVSDTPEMFLQATVEMRDVSGSTTLDSMLGDVHQAQWNTAPVGEDSGLGIQLETQPFQATDLLHENVFDT